MMNRYDAGELDVTTNMSQIVLARKEARNLLVYPTIDCYITLDDNDKMIFIPALMWTPISVDISSFNIRALGDSGKVYWQVWYV